MRSALTVLAALPLLAFAPLGDQPSFHLAKGAKVTKTFEQSTKLELEDLHVSFGDQEISKDQLGDPDLGVEATTKLVFTDEYTAMGDGRPTTLRRKFEELANRETQQGEGENGPEEKVTDDESELEGKAVVFTWSEEEGGFKKQYDGDKADEQLLGDLVEDCDLRAFLPGKPVSAGDEWQVEGQAFDFLLNPGGDVALVSDDDDPDSDEIDEQLRKHLEGDIKATYKGLREEGGVSVGVIALVCKVRSQSETSSDVEGAKTQKKYALELDVQGEILWDMKAGRPQSAGLTGRSKVTMDDLTEHDFEGETFSVHQVIVLGGEVTISATYADAE